MKDTIFFDVSKKVIKFVTVVVLLATGFFMGYISGFMSGLFFKTIW